MNWSREEILEYNKRCAKFLKWEYNKFMDRWNENFLHDFAFVYTEELKFYSDWNWIMEVVEAVEKSNHGVETVRNYCHITDTEIYSTQKDKKLATIEALHNFLILNEKIN